MLYYLYLRTTQIGYYHRRFLLFVDRALLILLFTVILSLVSCIPTQEAVTPGVAATLLTTTPETLTSPTPEPSATSMTLNLEETRLAEQCAARDTLSYQNDVLGIALTYPTGYELLEDEYLSPEYGFTVVGPGRGPVLRISWLYLANPEQQEQLIEEIIQQFSDISIERTPVEIGGRSGVMLALVPGEVANTVVYVSTVERLYTIRYFKGMLDNLGRCLLDAVRFYPPSKTLEELQLTPADDALYPSQDIETAVAQTEVAASATVTAEATAKKETPQPPLSSTPISLADVSSEWNLYDFPDLGISLSMPSDWEVLRYPESYFFAPIDTLPIELTIGFKANTPVELASMTEALTEELQNLTPFDFYTMPITVADFEGMAFWNLSPDSCVDIYVPAHGVVHQISFYSTFCNEAHDQLNEVGQRVLSSIELYPPTN